MILLVLAACTNPCQQVCSEMSRYADECGLAVDREDVLVCKEAQAEATDDEIAACSQWSDPRSLREWWTCEDLSENYAEGGGTDEGG